MLPNKNMYLHAVFVALFITVYPVCKTYSQAIDVKSVRIEHEKSVYETPRVFELVNIAVALTNQSSFYYNVVDTSTTYYRDVIQYFEAYKDHSLVDELSKSIKQSPINYLYNLQSGYNAVMLGGKVSTGGYFPFMKKRRVSS
jgi:hypothetical protein